MRRLILTALTLLFAVALTAQEEDEWAKKIKESQENALKEYESFKQQAAKDYEDFRRQANEEYAKFMEEAWKPFEAMPAENLPWKPKPRTPLVAEEEPEPEPNPEPAPVPDPINAPTPVTPSTLSPAPVTHPEPEDRPAPENVPLSPSISEPVLDPINAPSPVTAPALPPAPVSHPEPEDRPASENVPMSPSISEPVLDPINAPSPVTAPALSPAPVSHPEPEDRPAPENVPMSPSISEPVLDPINAPSPVTAPALPPAPVSHPEPEDRPAPENVPMSPSISEPVLDPINAPSPVTAPALPPAPEPAHKPVTVPDPVLVSDNTLVDDAAPVTELEPRLTPEPIPNPMPTASKLHGKSQPIFFDEVVRAPKQIKRPQPMEPIQLKPFPSMTAVQWVYIYGSAFPFHMLKERQLKLPDITEKSVAKMWLQLADPYYDNVIAECLKQREERNLCDWAYIKLTESVAEEYCGAHTNEAIVMQMYLLTQSGYQVRIARTDNKLTLLIGSEEKIFGRNYYKLEGLKFYIVDLDLQNAPLMIFDHAFPKERPLSLVMTQPALNVERTEQKTLTSRRYPDLKINVETNQNLIDFYNDYPLSMQWQYYSMASISNVVKESLYPALREAIKGKSELEAVNIILNLVQTGLEYQSDRDQFGYERPLYPDEDFFYPYCDCEDRSILFSCLVRELLGLDVVLLSYPEHIATAVHFNEDVEGDYLDFEGKRYIISDPTYMNAKVGMCAKKFKPMKPQVIAF